jgi:WD40 repeat protein
MDTAEPKRQTVEQLAEEFVERYRRGERPPLSEYTARYPEHAAEIRDLFPALVMMERIAPESEAGALADLRPSLRGRPIEHPEQIGDYRILREIGRGGMGVVYEAEQVSLGRHVALKVLPHQFLLDERQRKRFEREAKAAARLHHTNIVPVFGVGEENGLHYYVMQFIAGLGLDEVLDELKRLRPTSGGSPSPSPPEGVLQVSPRQVSAGAVAQSLLSGEFRRPDRMGERELAQCADPVGARSPDRAPTWVAPPGDRPPPGSGDRAPPAQGAESATAPGRLSDTYGLSASADALSKPSGAGGAACRPTYWQSVAHIGAQVAAGLEHAHQQGILHRDIKPANLLLDLHGNVWITDFGLAKSTDQENLTATGDVVGTLRYMAPEVFNGQHDPRSEVCALGLTLYELLALKPAFDESDRHRLIRQVTTAEPPRLDRLNPAIPRDVVTIVHKAIDRDPARRYATAAEMAQDLERFLRDEPVQARRASRVERLVRWARHHPGVAASLAVIGLLLVGAVVASTLAAWKFERLADEERWERYRSNIAAASAALQLQNTDTARRALTDAPERYRNWEWKHLHSQLDGASVVIPVPGGPVAALALSPSGRQVAVACSDHNEVYLFHVPSGRLEAVLRGHAGPITSLAYSPDVGQAFQPDGQAGKQKEVGEDRQDRQAGKPDLQAQTLATGAQDGTVRLWDPVTGHERAVLRGSPGFVALAYSPDGRRLAASTGDQLYLWDAVSGQTVANLGRHDTSPWVGPPPFGFDPTGRRLISGRGNEVCSWDAGTGKLVVVVGRFGSPVFLLAYNPDGKRIAAAAVNDPVARLWHAEAGKEVAALPGHTALSGLFFSADGSRLLTTGNYPDSTARLWDAITGQRIAVLAGHTNTIAWAAFSPDGRRIATASADKTGRLWDGATGQLIAVLRGHAGRLGWVRFSPDGRRVLTRSDDATLRLWDAETGELAAVLRGHGGSGGAFAVEPVFTPDGSYLLSGGLDGTVRLWDLRLVERQGILRGHGSFVYDVAFHPDGEEVASAAWDGTVRLWDATTGRQTGRPLEHTDSAQKNRFLSGVAYGRDGRQIVTACRGLGVTLWDATTSQRQQAWPIAMGYSVAPDSRAVLNPAGTVVAVGSVEGPVHLWDTVTGKPVATLEGHKRYVTDVAFRPDGAQLATAGEGGTVRLWDAVTHAPLAVLRGHSAVVWRVAYSADGSLLASGSVDKTIRLWDARTYREVAVIPMGSGVYGVAFSPDGTRLAAGCDDNTIRLLDVARRQEVAELRGHSDYVHAVAWSPDGTRLVSGSGDFTVRIWDSLPVQERARSGQGPEAPDPAR